MNAADFDPAGDVWPNSGSYTDFTKVGDPTVEVIGSHPAVLLSLEADDEAADDAFVGGDFAPESIVFDEERTIEAWVYNPTIANEETIVSWGKRGGPDGTNLSFNYGSNGAFGAVGHWVHRTLVGMMRARARCIQVAPLDLYVRPGWRYQGVC